MPGQIRHHLLSRGWQNNFADDHKNVTILDARTGAVVRQRQSTRSAFAEDHFNSYVTLDGTRSSDLEDDWGTVETTALPRIREVSPANARDDEVRAAVCEVFALHLVRSNSYAEAHRNVLRQVRAERSEAMESNDDARRLFADKFGREPRLGEMAALTEGVADEHEASNAWFVGSMRNMYNKIVERFAAMHVQVIEAYPSMGFVLGDVPIVHADSRTHRYGFRDGLAIGDADVIMGPLTCHTLVCLTTKPKSHRALKTKVNMQCMNAMFFRAAREVVACHPDDVRDAWRVVEHVRELPIGRLVGT